MTTSAEPTSESTVESAADEIAEQPETSKEETCFWRSANNIACPHDPKFVLQGVRDIGNGVDPILSCVEHLGDLTTVLMDDSNDVVEVSRA